MAKPILASTSGKRPGFANPRAGAALGLMQAVQIVIWLLTCCLLLWSLLLLVSRPALTPAEVQSLMGSLLPSAESSLQSASGRQCTIGSRTFTGVPTWSCCFQPQASLSALCWHLHSTESMLSVPRPCRFVGTGADHSIGTVSSTSGVVVRNNTSSCTLVDFRLAEWFWLVAVRFWSAEPAVSSTLPPIGKNIIESCGR